MGLGGVGWGDIINTRNDSAQGIAKQKCYYDLKLPKLAMVESPLHQTSAITTEGGGGATEGGGGATEDTTSTGELSATSHGQSENSRVKIRQA